MHNILYSRKNKDTHCMHKTLGSIPNTTKKGKGGGGNNFTQNQMRNSRERRKEWWHKPLTPAL